VIAIDRSDVSASPLGLKVVLTYQTPDLLVIHDHALMAKLAAGAPIA